MTLKEFFDKYPFISQSYIAKKTGVSQPNLSAFASGKNRYGKPLMQKVQAVINKLGGELSQITIEKPDLSTQKNEK